MLKKTITALLVSLIVWLVVFFAMPGPVGNLQRYCSDLLFFIRGGGRRTHVKSPVIVAIDEETLASNPYGVWPWRRDHWADLIERIFRYRPSAVVLTSLLDQPADAAADAALAAVMKTAGEVFLVGQLVAGGSPRKEQWRYVGPAPVFRDSRKGEGFWNITVDGDGMVRRVPLFLDPAAQGDTPRHCSLLLRLVIHQLWPEAVPAAGDGTIRLRVPNHDDIAIPVEGGGRQGLSYLRVDFRDPREQFVTVSYGDLFRERIEPALFAGRVVLVGTTISGSQDYYHAPPGRGRQVTGIEIMGSALDTLFRQGYIRPVDKPFTAVYSLLGSCIAGGCFFLIGPTVSWVVLLCLIFLIWLAAASAFAGQGVILPVAAPLLCCLALYLAGIVYHYTGERRRRRQTARAFQYYVSPRVVNQILSAGEKLELGGVKRTLTVLFSDIAGFTRLAESLAPEQLVAVLNEYLDAMGEVILAEEGTIDKYIGDAILAFWNAPLEQDDHPERACRAALAMQERLGALNRRWEKRGLPALETRIGVNTGEAIVGNFGSARRFDYTAIGDTVNLASRLEGANKFYGTSIIISFATFMPVMNRFATRELDYLTVKGKSKPVSILELVAERGAAGEAADQLAREFGAALIPYRKGNWDESERAFSELCHRFPADTASRVFLERSRTLRSDPPAAWNGVFLPDKK